MTDQELKAALNIHKKLTRLQESLDTLHITGGIGSASSNTPVQGGSKTSQAQIAADMAAEIDELQGKLVIEREIIKRGLDKVTLDEYQRKVMIRRYVDCMDWEDICYSIGYSASQAYMLHQSAKNKVINRS